MFYANLAGSTDPELDFRVFVLVGVSEFPTAYKIVENTHSFVNKVCTMIKTARS